MKVGGACAGGGAGLNAAMFGIAYSSEAREDWRRAVACGVYVGCGWVVVSVRVRNELAALVSADPAIDRRECGLAAARQNFADALTMNTK